jgi:hypothetical protein
MVIPRTTDQHRAADYRMIASTPSANQPFRILHDLRRALAEPPSQRWW